MPDISMCPGGDCVLKDTCYRYKATPTPEWQTYFVEPPYLNGTPFAELPDKKFIMSFKTTKDIPDKFWGYCGNYWHFVGK